MRGNAQILVRRHLLACPKDLSVQHRALAPFSKVARRNTGPLGTLIHPHPVSLYVAPNEEAAITTKTDLSKAIQAFVAISSQPAEVESWVERITASLLAQNPEVAGDAVLTPIVRSAVRAHWLAFLASLPEPAREVRLVKPGVHFARELARRGHPVTVLFRVYRLASQAVWGYITAEIEAGRQPRPWEQSFLMFFWGRVSNWLDASVEASNDVYQVERERALEGAAAQHLDAVRAVLAGGSPDPRELSALLGGHPVSSYNTAILLHTEDVQRIPKLTDAATQLAHCLKTRNPLLVSPGGRDLWAWFATRSTPDLDALRGCVPWLVKHDVTVAVGTPLEKVDGFRLSHIEAQQAQQISFRLRQPDALTMFPDVEILALLLASPEAAHRFVARTLGGLADDTEGPSRLRETMYALLSTGSVDEASRLLSVHKNTVRYRVSQAEALLGTPEKWVPAEVELAIRYYDSFLT